MKILSLALALVLMSATTSVFAQELTAKGSAQSKVLLQTKEALMTLKSQLDAETKALIDDNTSLKAKNQQMQADAEKMKKQIADLEGLIQQFTNENKHLEAENEYKAEFDRILVAQNQKVMKANRDRITRMQAEIEANIAKIHENEALIAENDKLLATNQTLVSTIDKAIQAK